MKKGVFNFFLFISFYYSCQNFTLSASYADSGSSLLLNTQNISSLHIQNKFTSECRYAYYYSVLTSMLKKISFNSNCQGGELAFWTPTGVPCAGVQGGDGNFYIITSGTPNYVCKMDTSNGSIINLGQIIGINFSVNGFAYNAVNDSYYICGYSGSANYLYKLDINTLTVTSVSTIGSSSSPIIAIAINSVGVGYGYDLMPANNAYRFNPVTGESTLLGPIGFDASSIQDMDIDMETDIIYLAAFNAGTNMSELRTMDENTGSTTLLSPMNDHISVFEFDNHFIVVPVEMTSFTATGFKKSVELKWNTSTETNNSGFEIQRSNDSKIEKLQNWEVIGFINGNGTTTEPQSYSFVDKNLEAGKYQYRLKQVDFDGRFEYSNIVEVEIAPRKISLEQNYPNPFNPSTTISWQSPVGSWQTLKVYDILGNEVTTLIDEYRNAGSYEVEFDASKHSSGVYFYQLRAGDFIETKKMILLK